MRTPPRHDPYAAVRCACNHLEPYHRDGRCTAGDHTRPCDCTGYRPPEES